MRGIVFLFITMALLILSCQMKELILRGVQFDHGDGLTVREGTLRDFEFLDPSGEWIKAGARITGNQIELDLPVGKAQGIRYAYQNDADPNLFNGAGLPASCFEIRIQP